MGLASIVEDVATTFPTKFTAEDNVEGFASKMSYHKKLGQLRDLCESLMENTDDTYLALGIDLMNDTDLFIDILQARRRGDGDLDLAMEKIDDYNQKFRSPTKPKDDGTLPNDPMAPITP